MTYEDCMVFFHSNILANLNINICEYFIKNGSIIIGMKRTSSTINITIVLNLLKFTLPNIKSSTTNPTTSRTVSAKIDIM